jgi:hypothetical protein
MNLTKFGIVVAVSGLIAFFIASQIRQTALQSEQERTEAYNPGHLFAHLTTAEEVRADNQWQAEGKANEASRHEKRVAEIEGNYWTHVVVTWLACAVVGFAFAGRSRATPAPATKQAAVIVSRPLEPAGPVMISCRCNACSGEIQFNEDGFDGQNPPTVTCPHCGADTVLYIPKGANP